MKPLTRLISPLFVTLLFLLMLFYPFSGKSADQMVSLEQKEALDIAQTYLETHQEEFGLSKAEIAQLLVTDHYVSQHSGVTHIHFRQRVNGLEVVASTINLNMTAEGEVFHVGNRLVACEVAARCGLSGEVSPALSAIEAVELAAEALGLRPTDSFVIQQRSNNAAQALLLSAGGISQAPIPVKLVYQPLADGTRRLAWQMVIDEIGGQHWWNVRVDAETGALLEQDDWVLDEAWQVAGSSDERAPYSPPSPMVGRRASGVGGVRGANGLDHAQYRVLPWPYVSPDEPGASFELVASSADAIASPFGWHDSDGIVGAEFTDTRGNNVFAQDETDGDNNETTPPNGGQALRFDFDFDPTVVLNGGSNLEAQIVNLFYWNNLSHDIFYQYGFDEASGNFQQNNYGRGGVEGDPVYADPQDGRSTNNASFTTPPEGHAARMQLYAWQHTIPNRGSSLENSIIVHEYGHGVSTRLTGGASNVACLFHDEQMGEGWSDWLALVATAKASDRPTQPRSIAPYLLGQAHHGAGIRPAPYTTEMSVNGYTYNDIQHLAIPHGVGFVWSAMLWDLYWNLVDEHGFNPNLYDSWQSGGNNLALQLVLDGMKLQPCEPGFVDARDAILSADEVLTGGANQCLIWQAFAKRGLGVSATQGSPQSVADGTEAFDLPAPCQFINVTPKTQDICVLPKKRLLNSSDDFSRSLHPFDRKRTTKVVTTNQEMLSVTVKVGAGFTPPVSLNATTNAENATLQLKHSQITSVPFSTSVTIDQLAQVTAGQYTLVVTGTAAQPHNAIVDFNLFTSTPDAPALLSPSNEETDVPYQPTFSWQAASQAVEYVLELDTEASFVNPDYTISSFDTSYTLSAKLRPLSTYYWRVRAINPCGESSYSATFRFTSKDRAPILLVDEDDNLPEALPLYRAALDAIDKAYDVWDVSSQGEPNVQRLAPYDMVIWFTAARPYLSAGPNTSSEAALRAYLDNGKCVLISSQDYYDRIQTSFMRTHLGVGSIENRQQRRVHATEGLFAPSDPYTLTYHFNNQSDMLSPNGTANVAFSGDQGTAAIYKDGGYYRTAYFAFPLSALPEDAAREQIMQKFIEWCDDLHTGTLSGTVRDVDSSQGVREASVTAKNAQVERTESSNFGGEYRMVLPVGLYTMTVTHPHYVSDTIRYIRITTDTKTSQEVVLQGSLLSYTPTSLDTTVELGQVISKQITISNTGPLSTTFNIDWHLVESNQAWLKAVPNSGELGPNSSRTIDLVFKPEMLSNLRHYTAWLTFSGSFVNQLNPLPIGMQLACSTCGVLEGKVTDIESGQAITPTIQVGAASGLQSTINDNDSYRLTLLPGPYTVTVSAGGYIQKQRVLTVTPNMTHTADFALIPAFATLEMTPNTFSNTLAFDKQLTNSLMISNLGTIDLHFNLSLNAPTPNPSPNNRGGGHVSAYSSFPSLSIGGGGHVSAYSSLPSLSIGGGAGGGGGFREGRVFPFSVLSDTGSVPPNGALEVDLLFDATSPALLLGSVTNDPVGSYFADLTISGNFTSTTIPLTMQLTCPDCALLSGSMSHAISGKEISATVQAINAEGLILNRDDVFTYTQLVLPDTYTMTVQADGYFSQTEVITVKAGASISQDWQLMPIFAQLSYSQAEVEQIIERNQQLTKTLLLSNTGSIPLTYVIAEAAAPSSCNLPYLIDSDFESGAFTNWHVVGGWFINDGSYQRAVDSNTTPALADRFSAISDQRGSVLAILYQDVALPTTLPSKMAFSWIDQWENHTRWFDDDQQFRVELYGPGGRPFLGELFSTDASYPNLSQATQRDVDVTELIAPYAGESVRLQFVVESEDYYLNVQVDSARCDEEIAWVSASPLTGTIPPFSNTTIDLLFDSQSITQTGTYNANLIFGSNSAQVAPLLPLKMHVVEMKELYLPLVLK